MKFVLWGTYCANALERRTPYRAEHLAELQQLKDEGMLLTLGPTEGSTHVFGLFEAADQATVERALKANIYWRHGIWTSLEIHPWIQAF